jgi:transcriptional regulator with XRE-family HTH domain
VPKTTKSSTALPQREIEIGERVRQIRLASHLKQPDFARALDVTRDRLAAHEYGRTPLKLAVGYAICRLRNVSLRWLATGKLPKRPFTPIAPSLLNKIGDRTFFSEAYDNELSKLVEDRLKEHAERAGVPVESLDKAVLIWDQQYLGISGAESHMENVIQLIQANIIDLDDDKKLAFALAVERAAFSFLLGQAGQGQKEGLTESSDFRKTSGDMKRTLKKLLEDVRRLTEPVGMKAQLAEWLTKRNRREVPQARVSEWLSGKHDPSGETTLQLLDWVEEMKRK